MRTVTRSDIAETLYQEVGLSRKDSGEILDMVLEEVKFKSIVIGYVGNVVGAHGGPGILAAVFLGNNR